MLSTRPNAGLKLIEKYDEYKSAKGKTPGTKLKPPRVKPILVEALTRSSAFVILYVEDTKKQGDDDKLYKRVRTFKGLKQWVANNFELHLPQMAIQKLESFKHELHLNKPLPAGYGFAESFRILEANMEFKELRVGAASYVAARSSRSRTLCT